MKVLLPLEITDDRVLENPIPEPDASVGEAVWSDATTYTEDQRVVSTTTHRAYKSAADANLNHPLPTVAGESNDWWLDDGPTNRLRMFDTLRNTQSEFDSGEPIRFDPGVRINGVGIVGVVADALTVNGYVGAELRYTRTIQMRSRYTRSWFDYFFLRFRQREVLTLFDFPQASGMELEIIATRAAGRVKIGGILLGSWEWLGDAQYGAVSSEENFSTISRDIGGEAILIPRRSVPQTSQEVWANKGNASRLRELRRDLNAKPALWVGMEDQEHPYFEPLQILGVFKRWSIAMEHPTMVVQQIELEEV